MRLLAASPERIQEILKELEAKSEAIKTEIIELIWIMKGGLSWSDAWSMSFNSRRTMVHIITENLKKANNGGKDRL